MKYLKPLLFLFLLFASIQAKADHCAGGELVYEYISDSTYKVTLKFFRDCRGIAEYTTIPLCVTNTCNTTYLNYNMTKISKLPDGRPNGSEIGTGCAGYPTTCLSTTSLIPGYREWWYTATIKLPSRCNFWRMSVDISARNTSVNLSAVSTLYLEATINNLDAPNNSSPTFNVKPIPFSLINVPTNFNNGVTDADNDSLVFDNIVPLSGSTTSCLGNPGFLRPSKIPPLNIINNPFQTNNTFVLNRAVGSIRYTPGELGPQTITFRVKEYRNNILIGTVLRDVQIQVLTDSTLGDTTALFVDTSSLVLCQYRDGTIYACAGNAIEFCFDVKSSGKGNKLIVTDNHNVPYPTSNISYVNQGTDSVRACFTLATTNADIGLRGLIVALKDSTCRPPAGIATYQVFTIPVHISSVSAAEPVGVQPFAYYCQYDVPQPIIATGMGILWYDSIGAKYGKPNPLIPNTSVIGKKNYYAESSNGCESTWGMVTVIVVPKAEAEIAYPVDTVCVQQPLLITNKKHKQDISYTWTTDSATIIANDSNRSITLLWKKKGRQRFVLYAANQYCNQYDTGYVYVVDSTQQVGFDLPETLCAGDTIMIAAYTPAQQYYWSATNYPQNRLPMEEKIFMLWKTSGTKQVSLSTQDANGCYSRTFTDSINILPQPAAAISIQTNEICMGKSITLSTVFNEYYKYKWGPASIFGNSTGNEALVSSAANAEVYVIVTDTNDCQSKAMALIRPEVCCALEMPDAFTPNNDGLNDKFRPAFTKNIAEFNMVIANRWGQIICTTKNITEGWDGRFKNIEQMAGTYNYYITYRCDNSGSESSSIKGSFILIK